MDMISVSTHKICINLDKFILHGRTENLLIYLFQQHAHAYIFAISTACAHCKNNSTLMLLTLTEERRAAKTTEEKE